MIGNDVVDLARSRDADAGALHPRFDARVFAPERARADRDQPRSPSAAPLGPLGAKESAYKAARKEDPTTVFSPRALRRQPSRTQRRASRVRRRPRFRVDVSV